jgi:hypothetical protein
MSTLRSETTEGLRLPDSLRLFFVQSDSSLMSSWGGKRPKDLRLLKVLDSSLKSTFCQTGILHKYSNTFDREQLMKKYRKNFYFF